MPWNYHIICVRVQKWSQAKGCSVTTSKRKEEITIKPQKTSICKHLLGSQQVSNWLWISNLDSVAVSAQDNAVLWEIKASNKSDSCCFQVQLLSLRVTCYCKLAGSSFPLLLGGLTEVKIWLNEENPLCSDPLTLTAPQKHLQPAYKSSIKCHCAWASLNGFLKRLWWLSMN